MKLFNRGGKGMGNGRGQGQEGLGLGRMAGPKAAGPVGVCRCPHCGHTQSHERGVPCMQLACPQCGNMMIRA